MGRSWRFVAGMTALLPRADLRAETSAFLVCKSALPRTADTASRGPPRPGLTRSGPDGAAPVASRSPDRTGVCRAGVGTLSAHEMTTGRVSHRSISPIKSGPRPIVTAQGRNRFRMPIVLPMSATGRSHLGNPESNKEKQIWLIREKRTKARGNNRKRPGLI